MTAKKPLRYRSIRYLAHVRGKPCVHCGQPGEPHHITFAQPKARGMKVGDQWVVPLCRDHHDQLHRGGFPERTFWALLGIDPMKWAFDSFQRWKKQNEEEFEDNG